MEKSRPFTTYKDLQHYSRPVQSLYNKFVLDPLARLATVVLVNHTTVKPYQVTLVSLSAGLASAWLFFHGQLLAGAFLFQIATILDGVDGYVARVTGNGSVAGILFDGYNDIVRVVVNLWALAALEGDAALVLLLFGAIHFAESMVDFELMAVARFLENKSISLNGLDRFFLKAKDRLESFGLKVNFLHYQERLFILFFIGPVMGQIFSGGVAAVIVGLVSFHCKMFFDLSLIKYKILNRTSEYLRGSCL